MEFRRTTLIWVGGFCFVLGMFLAKFYGWYQPIWLIALLPLGLSLRSKGLLSLLAVVLIGLIAGFARADHWRSNLIDIEALMGSDAVIEGRVATDAVYDDRGQLEFELDDLSINGAARKGRVRIRTFTQPAIYRYERVQVSGKLRSGFANRVASLSFAEVEIIGASGSWVEDFRRQYSSALFSTHTDQQASLALGILVGQRTTISEELDDTLRTVGLTHIIAVSGYNLTVLVRFTRRQLKFLSKFQSLILSIILVGVFLSIAGNSASIVRAAWVVGLSLAAGYFGRSIRPIVLLSLSAAATGWFDPYYVWFDLGWWLSFTAFFGVLMLAPVLNTRLFGTNKPGFWPELAVESLSATVLTAPLILWIFQRVSIVSLLSNMIVVPIVPIIMLLSFVAGGLYIASGLSYITKVVTLLSGKLLDGVVLVSETLAKAPFAEVSFGITALQMVFVYGVIVLSTYILSEKTKDKKAYYILD